MRKGLGKGLSALLDTDDSTVTKKKTTATDKKTSADKKTAADKKTTADKKTAADKTATTDSDEATKPRKTQKKAEAEEKSDDTKEQKVKISLIEPNSSQPRQYFNEEELNQLADSIKQHGIIEPIVVAPFDMLVSYS